MGGNKTIKTVISMTTTAFDYLLFRFPTDFLLLCNILSTDINFSALITRVTVGRVSSDGLTQRIWFIEEARAKYCKPYVPLTRVDK